MVKRIILVVIIVVAAMYTQEEISLPISYSINIETITISPDPTLNGDDSFFTLSMLKAACITDQSTYRTKALISRIKAKCGPAVLETMSHIAGWKDLIDFGPCKAYETLKYEYELGNAPVGRAILSPFISNNFDPLNLNPQIGRGRDI